MSSRCVRAGIGAAYAGAGVLPAAVHTSRPRTRLAAVWSCSLSGSAASLDGRSQQLASSSGVFRRNLRHGKYSAPGLSGLSLAQVAPSQQSLRNFTAVVCATGSSSGKTDSKEGEGSVSTKSAVPAANGNGPKPVPESASKAEDPVEADTPVTYVKAEGRIVAIGDLHGDLTKTLQSLELAGVLGRDEMGRPIWIGGNTVVVQMGDVMDRGDCEIGIVMLLRQLHKMARKEGGAVHMLNGNHESLNVCGDYRYVTAGAFVEAAMAAGLKNEQAEVWENQLRARVRLYSPGGPMAMELSKNPTVLVVNDTVFAHGGLLPEHATYGLKKINADVCRWMKGEKNPDGSPVTPPFLAMGDSNSIMWNRMYSRERFPSPYEKFHTCNTLSQTLQKVNAKRLVVGHTPQMEGANCECNQQIWRIDVGMSGGVLDAAAEILEISGSGANTVVRVVTAASPVAAKG